MAKYADTLWCDGCGVEIRWKPTDDADLIYCCKRCLHGEVCDCDEYQEEYPSDQTGNQNSYIYTEI